MTGYTQWSKMGNKIRPVGNTIKEIPPNAYRIKSSMFEGTYLEEMSILTDKLHVVPSKPYNFIVDNLQSFWSKEAHFKDFGMLYKRGILMYGAPGCGKTSIINTVSKNHTDSGGIVIYVEDIDDAVEILPSVRSIEPSRKLLCIIEDVEEVCRGSEIELLALLDGEVQVDNVAYIATTNYIEKLPSRVSSRPSRFDVVINVPNPDLATRMAYLSSISDKLRDDEDELNLWGVMTKGYSFAFLKELVLSVYLFELSLEESIERLNNMNNKVFKNSDPED